MATTQTYVDRLHGASNLAVGFSMIVTCVSPGTLGARALQAVAIASISAQTVDSSHRAYKAWNNQGLKTTDAVRLSALEVASVCVHLSMLQNIGWINLGQYTSSLKHISTLAGCGYVSLWILSDATDPDNDRLTVVLAEAVFKDGTLIEGLMYLVSAKTLLDRRSQTP